MSNGPVPHDDDGHDLDAINELQFKLDKKNKEFEKVCSIPVYNFYETKAKSYYSCTYISHNKVGMFGMRNFRYRYTGKKIPYPSNLEKFCQDEVMLCM